jgi:hypothetical protein
MDRVARTRFNQSIRCGSKLGPAVAAARVACTESARPLFPRVAELRRCQKSDLQHPRFRRILPITLHLPGPSTPKMTAESSDFLQWSLS